MPLVSHDVIENKAIPDMIEALEQAASILRDNPENAEALFNLIVWIRSNRNDPAHDAEVDKVENYVFSETEDCETAREASKKRALIKAVASTSARS